MNIPGSGLIVVGKVKIGGCASTGADFLERKFACERTDPTNRNARKAGTFEVKDIVMYRAEYTQRKIISFRSVKHIRDNLLQKQVG
jgi:hypothetical protein